MNHLVDNLVQDGVNAFSRNGSSQIRDLLVAVVTV